MQNIRNYYLAQNYQLSEADLDLMISQYTVHKKIKRFDFLLQEGEIATNFFFIIKGSFRSYIVQDNQEFTDVLRGPNEFYTNYVSFLTQTPNKYNLQALSDAELVGVSRKVFHEIALSNWNVEKVWRKETERLFIYRDLRDYILRLTAIERIQYFLQIRPALFQQIPHKYIASYLRMSPETFSRAFNSMKS